MKTQVSKKLDLGLDFPSSLEWREWEPGHEYRKTLSLTNITRKPQIIHWQQPLASDFFTEFQEPLRLNPGVTSAIGIIFKPSSFTNQESTLNLKTNKGMATVNLRGIAPTVHLQFPDKLEFGFSPVKDATKKTFHICNDGDVFVSYEWIVQPPFTIYPSSGCLHPGKSTINSCTFLPDKASPYLAKAVCLTNIGEAMEMKLLGVGKYPFLTLSKPDLQFGEVAVGSCRELYITIANTSDVLARIHLKKLEESMIHSDESVFRVDPSEASIQPNTKLEVKVLYSPFSASTFSTTKIDVVTSDKMVASFNCSGFSCRPLVRISSFSLDFGSLEPENHSTRFLSLHNDSEVHVSFQFMAEELGIFTFHESRGVIRPGFPVSLTITFQPTEVGNYYKRVFCILQDQYPLYCDLVGSCYKEVLNFSTLMPHHVTKHRESLVKLLEAKALDMSTDDVSEELDSIDNIEINDGPTMLNEDQNISTQSHRFDSCMSLSEVSSYAHKAYLQSKMHASGLEVYRDFLHQALSADEVWEEYFLGRNTHWNPVEVNPMNLDFGYSNCNERSSEVKHVTVTNISSTEVECFWLMKSYQTSLEDELQIESLLRTKGPWSVSPKDGIFTIIPNAAQIPPGGRVRFDFTFTPRKENQYYVEMLNCFVYQNSEEKDYVLPPWSACVQASGHTFASKSLEYLPNAYFFPSKVYFPTVLQGTCAYQTVALRNKGHTPLKFSFMTQNLSQFFSVKPLEGIVPEGSFQLISFRFISKSASMYSEELLCMINNSEKLVLPIVARSDIPKVELANGSFVCFKRTSIGIKTSEMITLSNNSGASAWFEWQIPSSFANILTVKPLWGIIRGRETLKLKCSFRPDHPKHYKLQIPCVIVSFLEKGIYEGYKVRMRQFLGTEVERISLGVRGEGIKGSVKIEPENIVLGTIAVGSLSKGRFSVFNLTEGSLEYALSFSSRDDVKKDSYALKFDNPKGSLPARTYREVSFTFRPKTPLTFLLEIVCIVSSSSLDEFRPSWQGYCETAESKSSCLLSATSLFPSMLVSGAKGNDLSTSQLWRQLRIEKLNDMFEEALLNVNIGNAAKQELFCLGAPIEYTSPFVFNFGSRNLGDKPTVFVLVLRSRNILPVAWKLRLWNDKEIEKENWVEEADPDYNESQYLIVRNQSLINIEPVRGEVKPGEEACIKLIYKHDLEGEHFLPAILQIKKGSSLPMMLTGKTLSKETKILTLESPSFNLHPVFLEDPSPPLQTFELWNDGNSHLKYKLDLSSLSCLTKENYGFEVISCQNPCGSIPPHESVLLNWLFKPIEAKSYSADLRISVEGGESYALSISGAGVDSSLFQDGDAIENNGELLIDRGMKCWTDIPIVLSKDYLRFDDVEECSVVEKLVSITNLPESNSRVSFSWSISFAAETCINGHFSVFPSEGLIECGSSCLCKISFTAGSHPQLFKTSLSCRFKKDPERVIDIGYSERILSGDEEVIIENWDRLGSYTYNKGCEHKSVISALTASSKPKLPRLAIRKYLGSPNQLTQAEEEVGGFNDNAGFVYLNVIGSVLRSAYKTSKSRPVEDLNSLPFLAQTEHCLEYHSSEELQDKIVAESMIGLLQESMSEVGNLIQFFRSCNQEEVIFFEQFQKLSPHLTPTETPLEISPSRGMSLAGQLSPVELLKEKSYVDQLPEKVSLKRNSISVGSPAGGERSLTEEILKSFSDSWLYGDFNIHIKNILENMLFDVLKELYES